MAIFSARAKEQRIVTAQHGNVAFAEPCHPSTEPQDDKLRRPSSFSPFGEGAEAEMVPSQSLRDSSPKGGANIKKKHHRVIGGACNLLFPYYGYVRITRKPSLRRGFRPCKPAHGSKYGRCRSCAGRSEDDRKSCSECKHEWSTWALSAA